MRKTKKMINLVVRDENDNLVYFRNFEQGNKIRESEIFELLHKADEIVGLPRRTFHTETSEIKVFC